MSTQHQHRVLYDRLGTNEIAVRCRCADDATLAIISLGAYLRMGTDAAMKLADSLCATCRLARDERS